MEKLYSADMKYDKSSVKILGKVMNKTVNFSAEIMRYAASVALVITGFYKGGAAGIISVAFGCILFSMGNVIQNWRTERSADAAEGNCIEVKYFFYENLFTVASFEQEQIYKYTDIKYLAEDENFYYIFPNRFQAFMVNKHSLQPLKEESFKRYVSSKTKRMWIRTRHVIRDQILNLFYSVRKHL